MLHYVLLYVILHGDALEDIGELVSALLGGACAAYFALNNTIINECIYCS